MRAVGCLVLVAGLQAEHKFLRSPDVEQTADKVLADAGKEQQELGRFLEEVKGTTTSLASQLQQANARIAELTQEDEQSKASLVHAKQAFKEQIKQVEVKLVEKVHAVEGDNSHLKKELSRANLNVQLHSKAEQDLKARLQQMGKVFSNQEQTVKSILSDSSDVAQALKVQDHVPAQVEEQQEEEQTEVEPAEVEAPEELSLPKVEEEKDVEEPVQAKVEEPMPKPVEAKVEEPKVEAKVEEPKVEEPKVEEAKAEEPTSKEASPLDSLASEVDQLATEADKKPSGGFAAPQQKADLKQVEAPASSSDLLDGANDELTSLLKQ